MPRYFSEEYFRELESRLSADPEWQEETKAIKTSVLLVISDQNASFLVKVEDGKTGITKTEQATPAEFSLEGNYDTWLKVGKGDVDFQSAVLKGLLKFKGSITKIIFYRERFMRMADVMRSIPVET